MGRVREKIEQFHRIIPTFHRNSPQSFIEIRLQYFFTRNSENFVLGFGVDDFEEVTPEAQEVDLHKKLPPKKKGVRGILFGFGNDEMEDSTDVDEEFLGTPQEDDEQKEVDLATALKVAGITEGKITIGFTKLPDWELLARLRDVDWSFFAEDDDDFGGDVGTTRSCCFRHWLKN